MNDRPYMLRIVSIIVSGLFFLGELSSQTCCSGGVPIASNLGFPSAEKKVLQISFNLDYNKLTSLYTNGERLDDHLRKRTTYSYLIRANYTITNRLAVEGFFSFVRQRRKIYGNLGEEFRESSFGIGDPVLLLMYKVVELPFKLRVGAGPQIPLGATDKRNSRGLFLVEDLQPGSGAWDLILFSSLEYTLPARPSLTFYSNYIHSFTGNNPTSRGGNFNYEFGNDVQLIAGMGDQFLLFNNIVTPGIAIRYRTAKNDLINSFESPGTGGDWLFLKASTGFAISKKSSINVSVEAPLYTRVNDTQLSPTVIMNFAFAHTFDFNKVNYLNIDDVER